MHAEFTRKRLPARLEELLSNEGRHSVTRNLHVFTKDRLRCDMYLQSTRARGCPRAWRSCWTKQSRRTPALRRATKMTQPWSTSCAATPQPTATAWTLAPQWPWSLPDFAASAKQTAGTARHGSSGNGVSCALAVHSRAPSTGRVEHVSCNSCLARICRCSQAEPRQIGQRRCVIVGVTSQPRKHNHMNSQAWSRS